MILPSTPSQKQLELQKFVLKSGNLDVLFSFKNFDFLFKYTSI